MPPRKKEETAAAWATRADGTPINPNSSEGMVLSGELRPRAPQAPYTEALEPANAAALLAATPDADGATTLAKEPPAGVEFFKLHVADEKFPEAPAMLACNCMSDQLEDVLEAMMGTRGGGPSEPERYRNPKSGLEFEWVVPPANFYDKAAPGWEAGKMAEDVQAEGDDADDRE